MKKLFILYEMKSQQQQKMIKIIIIREKKNKKKLKINENETKAGKKNEKLWLKVTTGANSLFFDLNDYILWLVDVYLSYYFPFIFVVYMFSIHRNETFTAKKKSVSGGFSFSFCVHVFVVDIHACICHLTVCVVKL